MATSALTSPLGTQPPAWLQQTPAQQQQQSSSPSQVVGDRFSLAQPRHESVYPFPADSGPEAGASAVIDAENNGLLSVAAVGTLVAGIAALGVPMAFELSGSRVKNRKNKFLAETALKNDEATQHVGSGTQRVFAKLDNEYRQAVEVKLAATGNATLKKLRKNANGRVSAQELHDLRKQTFTELALHAYDQGDHETARVAQRMVEIHDKLGPVIPASGKISKRMGTTSANAKPPDFHANRALVRPAEFHVYNRFAGLADGIAMVAAGIGHLASHHEPVEHAALTAKLPHVERAQTPAQIEQFYQKVAGRKQPWVRTIHTASYIDQKWPGLLQDAAAHNTKPTDEFEVWLEHAIPAKRVTTDQPIPESKQRVVGVVKHLPENDAALKRSGYSLGRELDVAYGNYAAFKAGPAAAKMRQILHRYSLYVFGAKDTMSNPRGMGMVLANLGVTSITLSALLYGMLYLTEYWRIESDLKKHNIQTNAGS